MIFFGADRVAHVFGTDGQSGDRNEVPEKHTTCTIRHRQKDEEESRQSGLMHDLTPELPTAEADLIVSACHQ